jgi:hypothetical protein
MKKIILVVLLVLLALPIFSQEKDSRAPFQGIWYGVIYSGEVKVFVIFIDDIFISHIESDSYGRYSVEGSNLILTNFRELGIDGWEEIRDETGKIQYVFSGDKLILVFDGEPITFSRDYTDFIEWNY